MITLEVVSLYTIVQINGAFQYLCVHCNCFMCTEVGKDETDWCRRRAHLSMPETLVKHCVSLYGIHMTIRSKIFLLLVSRLTAKQKDSDKMWFCTGGLNQFSGKILSIHLAFGHIPRVHKLASIFSTQGIYVMVGCLDPNILYAFFIQKNLAERD